MAFLLTKPEEEEYDTTLTRKQIDDLTLAFYKHESYPGSNEINSKSLVKVLRSLGENPSSKEVMDMANELDQGSGRIQFKQFLNAMEIKMKEHKLDEDLKSAFQVFDKDGNGTIPLEELRVVLRVAVDTIPEKELNEMMAEMDLNGDGVLDYGEFVAALTV